MKINGNGIKKIYRSLALSLGGLALILPATAKAATNAPPVFFGSRANYTRSISSFVLPVPRAGGGWQNCDYALDSSINKMTVSQDGRNAVAEWNSFDVGEKAWVYFNQKGNTDWKILNRIYDVNPSRIFGRVTGDGSVYLINQNGILFGRGSSINVHSLVASALNVDNNDFLDQQQDTALSFTMENYAGLNNWDSNNSIISNEGEISVELIDGEKVIRNGSVFLMAPHVENSGTIVAPFGQVALVAADEVQLEQDTTPEYTNEKIIRLTGDAGYAVNREQGKIVADNGLAGLYGAVVNQEGLIRSVTSVYHRGRIQLRASEKITTGIKSETLTPVTDSPEPTGKSYEHKGGEIYLAGLDPAEGPNRAYTGEIVHQGLIYAPSGEVLMRSSGDITLGDQSLIDVAGLWSNRSADALWFTQEMNSAQLKDDHLQKDGIFYRHEVTVNELFGSTIGDFADTYANAEMTSRQKASRGGSVSLRALGGHIDIRQGAKIDISGGGHFNAGSAGSMTKVVYGNKVINISEAPAELSYEYFVDYYEKTHERYRVTDVFKGIYYGGNLPLYDYLGAHKEGHDAGSLEIIAKSFSFNGYLLAGIEIGPYQSYGFSAFDQNGDGKIADDERVIKVNGKEVTEKQRRPAGGRLTIGGDGDGELTRNIEEADYVNEVIITAGKDEAGATDPDFDYRISTLPAEVISNSGAGYVEIKSNYRISVAPGALVEMEAGARLSLTSRRIDHEGAVSIPSGKVTFTVRENSTTFPDNTDYFLDFNELLYLEEKSRIDVSGEQLDNWSAVLAGEEPDPAVMKDGGAIVLQDTSKKYGAYRNGDPDQDIEVGEGVIVAESAVLDVSGGYEITEGGKVTPGNGGAISISGSNVVLAGELRGHSLAGAEGGTLSLTAGRIDIVGGESASLALGRLVAAELQNKVLADSLEEAGLQEDFDQLITLLQGGITEESLAALEAFPAGAYLDGGEEINDLLARGRLYLYERRQYEDVSQPFAALAAYLDQDQLSAAAPLTTSWPSFTEEGRTNDTNFLLPPESSGRGLIINEDAFRQSGFSHLSFNAGGEITIADNVYLVPSLTRLSPPNLAQQIANPLYPGEYYEEIPYLYGPGSLSFSAGNFSASKSSSLVVHPGGTINIETSNDLRLDCVVEAPAGVINVSAVDLVLGSTARLLATGYNVPAREKEYDRLDITYTPLDGGRISLVGSDLLIEKGALVDVSGSRPVITEYYSGRGDSRLAGREDYYVGVRGAGAAGSISLEYQGSLDVAGDLAADSYLAGLVNGSLTIVRSNPYEGLRITTELLDIFRDNDFYGWIMGSSHSLLFEQNLDFSHYGSVTLDSPTLVAASGAEVKINAHELFLDSSRYPAGYGSGSILYADNHRNDSQEMGTFTLSGDYLDVNGMIKFDNTVEAKLSSAHDIRLSDRFYVDDPDESRYYFFAGWLANPSGSLTLEAERIYPTSLSDFILYAGDTLTTLPAGNRVSDNIIYSAGSSLTLIANRVDHQGYVAAPLGSLSFIGITEEFINNNAEFLDSLGHHDKSYKITDAEDIANSYLNTLITDSREFFNREGAEAGSRIMVGADSVTTVAGASCLIDYGEIDEKGVFWTIDPTTVGAFATRKPEDVTVVPAKTITLDGDEVVLREGADIDLSGSGGLFAHRFLPGIDGTGNPLLRKNQYLLVPGFDLPGRTVTITRGSAIAAGTYTILELDADHGENAKFAFLPGAMILIDQGNSYKTYENTSVEGYELVSGLFGHSGLRPADQSPTSFAVRSAEDVINEGYFALKSIVAGKGGSFTLKGRESLVTSVIEADINAHPLDGFAGGAFAVAAREIEVSGENAELDPDFTIDDELPAGLRGKLFIKDTTFSGNGFADIAIGDETITRSVVFKENSLVRGRNITVAAGSGYDGAGNEQTGLIAMEENSTIVALDDNDSSATLVFKVDSEGGFAEDDDDHGAAPGAIELAETSVIRTVNAVLSADNIKVGGNHNFAVDQSLFFATRRVIFAETAGPEQGLYLSQAQWDGFGGIREITVNSATDIIFNGNYDLTADNRLTFDAGRIGGYDADTVSIAAPYLVLRNSGNQAGEGTAWLNSETDLSGNGAITFTGGNFLTLGPGVLELDGFGTAILETSGDLALTGQGKSSDGSTTSSMFDISGDLVIDAARVTLAPEISSTYNKEEDQWEIDLTAADFHLRAAGDLTVHEAGASSSAYTFIGGALKMEAGDKLVMDGLIDTIAGRITLEGQDVVVGGTVNAVGSDEYGGGIYVNAASSFALNSGVFDVSAGSRGDAGFISIRAPEADLFSIDSASQLSGRARGGRGGSFFLDVTDLSGATGFMSIDELAALLGDFDHRIDLRSRQNNMILNSSLAADYLKLTADGGRLDIYGSLNGLNQGVIELNSGNDLNLYQGSVLSNADSVYLASGRGWINFLEGAEINLGGDDASLYIRTLTESGVSGICANLNGALVGVNNIDISGVLLYEDTTVIADGVPDSGDDYFADATDFGNGAAALKEEVMKSLGYVDENGNALAAEELEALGIEMHVRPELEIRSDADLTVTGEWNLDSKKNEVCYPYVGCFELGDPLPWLFGGERLNLTLRAAADLIVDGQVVATPTSNTWGNYVDDNGDSVSSYYQSAWGNYVEDFSGASANINLVAGADHLSADIMAVRGDGSLHFGGVEVNNMWRAGMVYSETGDVSFASAGDTIIDQAPDNNSSLSVTPTPWSTAGLQANLSSYRGDISGRVGGDLIVNGVIQSGSGNIDIDVAGNLDVIDNSGAVRTTGLAAAHGYHAYQDDRNYWHIDADMMHYYEYGGGGDIVLDVAGSVRGGFSDTDWAVWWGEEVDSPWSASYLLTIDDYNLRTTDGDRVESATLGLAAMAGGSLSIKAGGDISGQAATFGAGDLTLQSGSNIDGRFLNRDGRADIHAQGSVGTGYRRNDLFDAGLELELGDSILNISSQGSVDIHSVQSPAPDKQNIFTEATGVSLKSNLGNVRIAPGSTDKIPVLPGTLQVNAANDIIFYAANLLMAPSGTGQLQLTAGHDILGAYAKIAEHQPVTITMEQYDPATYYGLLSKRTKDMPDAPLYLYYDEDGRKVAAEPVVIRAGNDISDLHFNLPRSADIFAGGNINDLELKAQNILATDITRVRAVGDIILGSYERGGDNAVNSGYLLAGPGALFVQAGGDIDLGTTLGIRTVANGFAGRSTDDLNSTGGEENIWADGIHPGLDFEGADIYVTAGPAVERQGELGTADVDGFFDTIRLYGKLFSMIQASDTIEDAVAAMEKEAADTAPGTMEKVMSAIAACSSPEAAARAVEDLAREEAIGPMFGRLTPVEPEEGGRVIMTQSQIATHYGGDINILAANAMDVGYSFFSSNNEDAGYDLSGGIKTEFGGDINIYSVGDLNVNESRIMTWMGGDMTFWSEADINAGRGSKTAVNASGNNFTRKNEKGVYEIFKKPSASGSGIRALTYDPDGPGGPREMPEPGDIYLFAPSGIIDAGEAGIVGGAIYLAATEVLNARNITFNAGGVGVPIAADTSLSLGAISGAGNIAAAAGEVTRNVSGLDEAGQKALDQAAALTKDLKPRWVEVKVLDIIEDKGTMKDENM